MNCRLPDRLRNESSAYDQNCSDESYPGEWSGRGCPRLGPLRADRRPDDGPDDLARPEVALRFVRAKIVARTVVWLEWLSRPAVYTRDECEALPRA